MINDLLKYGISELSDLKNKTNILNETRILLCNILNVDKTWIVTHGDEKTDNNIKKLFYDYIKKRKNNMPIAYIINKKEFMGMQFYVNEDVLIPRPDTECLVEYVIDTVGEKTKSILDIGTGSGAISISIAKLCKNTSVMASDISSKALNIAKKNAEDNFVSNILFVNSNIFENITKKFDIIISNPPYIPTKIIPTLSSNVKDYEPILALDGGEDGMLYYDKILKEAYKFLNRDGKIIFEIGFDQADLVTNLFKKNNFKNIKILKDLYNNDRIATANICNEGDL